MRFQKEMMLFLVCLGIFLISLVSVSAYTQCSGGVNCPVNVSASINNIAPALENYWVNSGGTSLTLTGGQNTTFLVYVNISDANSQYDIVNISGSTTLTVGGNTRTYSLYGCTNWAATTNNVVWRCSLKLPYATDVGSRYINISIKDLNNNNYPFAFSVTVNALDYITQDRSSLVWSQIDIGDDKPFAYPNNYYVSQSPLKITNLGNQDYSKLYVTGYSLFGTVNPSAVFNVTQIGFIPNNSTSPYSSAPHDVNPIYGGYGDGVQHDYAGVFFTGTGANTHGDSGSEFTKLYSFTFAPQGILKDVYHSSQDWQVSVGN